MDNHAISLDQQRELIEELARLIAERAQTEISVKSGYDARQVTTNSQFEIERDRFNERAKKERETLHAEHTQELSLVAREYEQAVEHVTAHNERVFKETAKQTQATTESLKEDTELARQKAEHDYHTSVRETSTTLQDFKQKLEDRREDLQNLDAAADRVIRRRRCRRAAEQLPEMEGSVDPSNPLDRYAAEFANLRQTLNRFHQQIAARMISLGGMIAVMTGLFAVAIIVGIVTYSDELSSLSELREWVLDRDKHGGAWLIGSAAVAFGFTAIMYVVLRPIVVSQTLSNYQTFQTHLANADRALEAARAVAVAEADTKRARLKEKLDLRVKDFNDELARQIKDLASKREAKLKSAADELQSQRKSIGEGRAQKQQEVNTEFDARRAKLESALTEQSESIKRRYEQEVTNNRETLERSWSRLVKRWSGGLADFQNSVEGMHRFCEERFPNWSAVDWSVWNPPDDYAPALRFGEYSIGLKMFEGGVPDSSDLAPPQVDFALPAVMSFANRPSLLFETWGAGRDVASQSMQNVMLRFITSLPPGKVRFTIIDPVGLGQNFSAFMHLTDFDERLVSHRIWTESNHINKRLSDLTEHMEDVIQTYLRNEFRTIDEYNRHAGEVAEPFHVLVVANFPAGFSDEAAQRLLSVVASGARCGVYSLISVDTKLDLPRNFDVGDLEANAVTVQWNGDRFVWLDEDIKDLPLRLDEPPNDEQFTDIIRKVGKRAKEANRVEVPFATVAAKRDEWWTRDSRDGINVALGRAGATKLRHLNLGKGTSQHVLISGKTGSGKSTLLHALIVNTAIHYSPDEVEFYLIDFKKGVEFKPYASLKLPHARVVAIESEREFGMSVLERLDLELRRRGDLFREHGVQDIKGFRNANPDTRMPRVLLIIDEFQEFFVQDDKLSQDAALLFDRLVRQGRAFGIHVLLGSQTLAGAYSLARSTIGQMAVRIALQCSEADSHLILSEDNTAARLLSRPGEAIYNDANGLFEGNHPFQVVWLSADEQEEYLRGISGLEHRFPAQPAIVFEGNALADPSENKPLRDAIERDDAERSMSPSVWLGAAVSIKEPSATVLRRQSGSNLLIVGQQEEMTLGVLANSLISLGANWAGGNGQTDKQAQFYVFDGTRPDAPQADFWRRLVDELPLNGQIVIPRDAAEVIGTIANEVTRRVDAGDDASPPIFTILYNLSRFRDLRRSDDDFGFSSFDDDKPVGADKKLVEVLREGPAFGVHTLIWCDTFNNLNRWLDRQTLRDLDHRALFQMSATDSSNLMDSPVASRLGTHRAILYSEEQGQFEKFRPYAMPSDEWIEWVKTQLTNRTENASVG